MERRASSPVKLSKARQPFRSNSNKKASTEAEAAGRFRSLNLVKKLLRFQRLDHYELAHLAAVFELDPPADLREQSVIAASAYIQAWFHSCPALADNNCPARHNLPAESFESQSLRVRVATVS
jgi:hypothetical protein